MPPSSTEIWREPITHSIQYHSTVPGSKLLRGLDYVIPGRRRQLLVLVLEGQWTTPLTDRLGRVIMKQWRASTADPQQRRKQHWSLRLALRSTDTLYLRHPTPRAERRQGLAGQWKVEGQALRSGWPYRRECGYLNTTRNGQGERVL